MENNYTQLCVWPGVIVGQDKVDEFESFFKNEFNARVKYLTEIKTNPDRDKRGNSIPDTGGRNDIFFYVHNDDIGHFAVPRLAIGIRWWEDVLGNGHENLYPSSFLNEHKPTW